jgi:hypothetical protein
MQQIEVTSDQCFLLCAALALELTLHSDRIREAQEVLLPYEDDRAP